MDLSKLSKTPDYNTAYGEYSQYLGTTKNPLDHYNEAVNSLGIPDARARVAADRKAISDTQNLVDAVDPSVTGRTQGSLVTEAQRQGLVTKEKSPLLESLGRLGGIYGTSSGNLADLMGQASQNANFAFQGDQANLSALWNRVGGSMEAEQLARAKAAQDSQNAWIKALMDNINSMKGQLNNQTTMLDNTANSRWQAMQNRAITGNTYNPQKAVNVFQKTGSPMPKTYNPQRNTAGNINNIVTSNLRVNNRPSNSRVSVTSSPTRKATVTSTPKRTVSVSGYNPGRISGVYY